MILRKEFPPAIYLSDIRAYLRWYLTLHLARSHARQRVRNMGYP
jgi:hypothetical protein